MKKSILLLPLAALAMLVLFLGWPRDAAAPPRTPSANGLPAMPAGSMDGADPGTMRLQREAVAGAQVPNDVLDVAGESRIFPAERMPGAVFGVVVDAQHAAAAGAEVEAVPTTGQLPPGLIVDDDRGAARRTTSGADGSFRFDALPEGPYRLRADRGAQASLATTLVVARGDERPVTLALEDRRTYGDDLRVIVVDGDDRPVAGADVQVFAWSRHRPDPDAERSLRAPLATACTGTDGRCAVTGRGLVSGIVHAQCADGRIGFVPLPGAGRRDPLNVCVAVAAPGALDLRLHGLPATELDGATVSLHALSTTDPYGVGGGRTVDHLLAGDRVTIVGLAAGTYVVGLAAPRGSRYGARFASLPDPVALPQVKIVAGETTTATLEVVAGAAIRGVVLCGDRPVRGARIRGVLAPRTSNFPAGFVLRGAHVWRLDGEYENGPSQPGATVVAHTDDAGRYELLGLAPGAWRVEVAAPSLSFDRRQDVPVADGRSVELRHELVRAGVLQLCVPDATYVGVLRPGVDVPLMLAIVRDDIATFPGLAPGRYHVARCHSDSRVAPVILADAGIVAGRTTWLDLRGANVLAVVRGKVLAGADPVAGARVVMARDGATTTTSAAGDFRIELGHVPRFDGPGSEPPSLSVEWRGCTWSFSPRVAGRVDDIDTALQLGEHFVDVVVTGPDSQPLTGTWNAAWRIPEQGPNVVELGVPPDRVGGSGKLTAGGTVRLGPFPPGRLGVTIDRDGPGLRGACQVPRAEPLRIVSPPTATLVVRVVRGGKVMRGADVRVATWSGPGAIPEALSAIRRSSWEAARVSDDGGTCTFTVAAGDVAVFHGPTWEKGPWQRVHVEPGATASVTLPLP